MLWRDTSKIMRRVRLGFLVLALFVASSGVASAEIVGRPTVIDGDTLEIRGQRIRLHGIDTPEPKQPCVRRNGGRWQLGNVRPSPLPTRSGPAPSDVRRRTATDTGASSPCASKGGEDLNAWLVSRGWAVAYRRYSTDYVDEEKRAREAGIGIWSGRFVVPWKWRRGERLRQVEAGGQQPSACRIKGNINRKGERIYHVPGERWYDRVRIDPSKGERWFCSEEEARAAGWRRSRQ